MNEKKYNIKLPSFPFIEVFVLMLTFAKVFNNYDITWFQVFLPLIAYYAIIFGFVGLVVLIAAIFVGIMTIIEMIKERVNGKR